MKEPDSIFRPGMQPCFQHQMMTTRPLGRTGFHASRIGIGDIADRNVPLAECVRTLHRAMDFGLNLIDTAPGYESGVDQRYVELVLPMARRMGLGTVCFKTFGAGKLLGDTTGYNQPLQERPRGKFSSGGVLSGSAPELPCLSVDECLHYTLTLNPDVALLGLSFPNEQDAALEAFKAFRPLSAGEISDIRCRSEVAIQGKGPCWWNPE